MKGGEKLYIDGFQQKIFDSLLLTCCLVDHNDDTEIESSFPPIPLFFFTRQVPSLAQTLPQRSAVWLHLLGT